MTAILRQPVITLKEVLPALVTLDTLAMGLLVQVYASINTVYMLIATLLGCSEMNLLGCYVYHDRKQLHIERICAEGSCAMCNCMFLLCYVKEFISLDLSLRTHYSLFVHDITRLPLQLP